MSLYAASDTAEATAALDAEIVRLKNTGLSFQEVANQVGKSKGYTHKRFWTTVRAVPAAAAAEYRERHLAEIAMSREVALDVLAGQHPLVQQGRVIREITGRDDNGKPIYGAPLTDSAPALAAMDRLSKLREEEAKLFGLYAAVKLEQDISLRYEVVGVDPAALT